MLTLIQKTQLIAAFLKRGYNPIGAYNEANGVNAERYYQEYCSNQKIVIGDLFIGNFRVTQKFGNDLIINKIHIYRKFRWKGHNGIDFGCPTGTKLVSCCNGKIVSAFNDGNGWGNHIYIYDESQKVLYIYAHLKNFSVKVGQKVKIGKLIGQTDNTGNSTAPHLHFGAYRTDEYGRKINLGNGYGGAVNPFDKNAFSWVIVNPKKPV